MVLFELGLDLFRDFVEVGRPLLRAQPEALLRGVGVFRVELFSVLNGEPQTPETHAYKSTHSAKARPSAAAWLGLAAPHLLERERQALEESLLVMIRGSGWRLHLEADRDRVRLGHQPRLRLCQVGRAMGIGRTAHRAFARRTARSRSVDRASSAAGFRPVESAGCGLSGTHSERHGDSCWQRRLAALGRGLARAIHARTQRCNQQNSIFHEAATALVRAQLRHMLKARPAPSTPRKSLALLLSDSQE